MPVCKLETGGSIPAPARGARALQQRQWASKDRENGAGASRSLWARLQPGRPVAGARPAPLWARQRPGPPARASNIANAKGIDRSPRKNAPPPQRRKDRYKMRPRAPPHQRCRRGRMFERNGVVFGSLADKSLTRAIPLPRPSSAGLAREGRRRGLEEGEALYSDLRGRRRCARRLGEKLCQDHGGSDERPAFTK